MQFISSLSLTWPTWGACLCFSSFGATMFYSLHGRYRQVNLVFCLVLLREAKSKSRQRDFQERSVGGEGQIHPSVTPPRVVPFSLLLYCTRLVFLHKWEKVECSDMEIVFAFKKHPLLEKGAHAKFRNCSPPPSNLSLALFTTTAFQLREQKPCHFCFPAIFSCWPAILVLAYLPFALVMDIYIYIYIFRNHYKGIYRALRYIRMYVQSTHNSADDLSCCLDLVHCFMDIVQPRNRSRAYTIELLYKHRSILKSQDALFFFFFFSFNYLHGKESLMWSSMLWNWSKAYIQMVLLIHTSIQTSFPAFSL